MVIPVESPVDVLAHVWQFKTHRRVNRRLGAKYQGAWAANWGADISVEMNTPTQPERTGHGLQDVCHVAAVAGTKADDSGDPTVLPLLDVGVVGVNEGNRHRLGGGNPTDGDRGGDDRARDLDTMNRGGGALSRRLDAVGFAEQHQPDDAGVNHDRDGRRATHAQQQDAALATSVGGVHRSDRHGDLDRLPRRLALAVLVIGLRGWHRQEADTEYGRKTPSYPSHHAASHKLGTLLT